MLAFDLQIVRSRGAGREAANDGGAAFAGQLLILSPLHLV